MKEKVIILIFTILLAYPLNGFSQDTIHAKYFPLHVGDVFVYNWICTHPSGSGVYRVKIIKDTVINFKRYFKASPSFVTIAFYSSWLRVDSLTCNIYQYAGTGGCNYNPGEYLVDSLRANLFDTARTCNSANDYRKCYDTGSVNIFGHQTSKKEYNDLIMLSPSRRRYAKHFGIIYSSYGDPYPTYNTLKGCVINGIVYGDTSVPTVIKTISIKTPERYRLFQSYPNPFNPTTKIKFQIVKFLNVKLEVYDALGREVETLVNEEMSPGKYEVEFDGSDYPSGVYYYKLYIENYSETKSMVLLK